MTGTRLVVNSTFLAPPHLPITAKVAVPAWQAQINLANYRVLVIDALRASWLARHGLLEVGGGDCGCIAPRVGLCLAVAFQHASPCRHCT